MARLEVHARGSERTVAHRFRASSADYLGQGADGPHADALLVSTRALLVCTSKKRAVVWDKIIHGYGSTGKGGRLRKATQTLLDELKKSGSIKEFVGGEQWSKLELRTLTLIDRMPQLFKDPDLERSNRGITVVFL
jgi:hypothetical protein